MATLVLTAVGTAVGGPIGGAIAAIIGQQVDHRLFAPKARHGPRLGDLSVQTSTYGTALPRLFGTLRVAGTVVWATDLREQRSSGGGGKGRPKTVEFSYSASFAVALSARPIRAVRRIWADGKLLRGAAGDFKSATGFRLHLGGEDQPIDPLIAAAEGPGLAPAYRGLAYALFEDFQLADYGNRIPSLSFEVEADAGPVPIGAIAEELAGGELIGGETPSLAGYAAAGDSIRGALEALADAVPLSLSEADGRLRLEAVSGGEAMAIAGADSGARAGSVGGRTRMSRQAATMLPSEVSLAYYDPSRDYQTGLQRATRGGAGARGDRHSLAAAMPADAAKALAEAKLAARWAARAGASLHLPPRLGGLRPGAVATIEGQAGRWRVARWTLEQMVASVELVRLPGGAGEAAPPASPGRPVAEADAPHGQTALLLLDLPLSNEPLASRPSLLVAAAGREEGWRSAALTVSYDQGLSWTTAGRTAPPAVIGQTLDALPPAGSALIDRRHSVEVELLHGAMWLESRSDDALVAGANLAAVGDELIQFGEATPLGANRFRLSRLLRGRRGTEWAAAHAAGEPFVLIAAETLATLEPPAGTLGGEARLLASGIGDPPGGVAADRAIEGEAIRPPSPVHLTAEARLGGDILIRWVRRSRDGWTWLSGVDTPLAEERELYRLRLSGAGFARETTTVENHHLYTAAEQLADGLAGPLAIAIAQLGTAAASRPAAITFG
jgi:hypothetical protein